LITLDDQDRILHDIDIAIEDGAISAVGEAPAGFVSDEVINGRERVALPGFFNAHTHAAMTLERGWAEDLPFERWLNEKIRVAESALEEEDVYWGAALACCEMIRAGIVGFADHYFWMDQVARAVEEAGGTNEAQGNGTGWGGAATGNWTAAVYTATWGWQAEFRIALSKLRITNTGTAADIINLSHTGPSTWTVSYSSTLSLAAGAGADVEVTVTIPATAPDGDTGVVTVTAASQADPTKTGAAILTTMVSWRFTYLPIVMRNY
jgi:hypothetical protein